MNQNGIPKNIYYSQEHDNFYHAETKKGQGWEFHYTWHRLARQFPQAAAVALQPSAVSGEDVKLVEQQCDTDCGPCCMAMLTGLTRDEVIDRIGGAWHPEHGMRQEWAALRALGFEPGSFMRFDTPDNATAHELHLLKHLTWKRRSILTVPSLNRPGKWHLVYYDGENLYDPSNKKRYETWEEIEPVECIIFDEIDLVSLPTVQWPTEKEIARILITVAKQRAAAQLECTIDDLHAVEGENPEELAEWQAAALLATMKKGA